MKVEVEASLYQSREGVGGSWLAWEVMEGGDG